MKKLMNNAGVIFLALIFMTRCSNHSNDTKGQTLDVGSSKIEEKFVPEAENVKTNEKQALGQTSDKPTKENEIATTVNELIQGKWQSMDDKTNFLIFDKDERKESIDGMNTWHNENFLISNKCLNESDKELELELEKDKYISFYESDLCWYIISINKDFLTVSYVGRGNTLKYKRVM